MPRMTKLHRRSWPEQFNPSWGPSPSVPGGMPGRSQERPEHRRNEIVDRLGLAISFPIGLGIVAKGLAEIRSEADRHLDGRAARPDEERSVLAIGTKAVAAADQARALRNEDRAPGGAVADILSDLSDDQPRQIGVEARDQAGRVIVPALRVQGEGPACNGCILSIVARSLQSRRS